MGGKTSTTTSDVTIPKNVMSRYDRVNRMAEKLSDRKFRNYKGDFVAGINDQQRAGMQTINNAAGSMQPYLDQAAQYTQQGAQTVSPQDLQIEKYYNPYQSEVIDATSRLIDQGNEQAMSGSLGDAIKSGTFGGDRAGIAAAVLAGQQQAQRANTLAGLKQQGYQQAVSTAQQQQGVDLGARQADLARYTQAGQQYAGLGQMAQQGQLAAGESQINAGTLQQQTEQADKTARYQQFLQRQGYPFQIAQFLANIAMGTGSLSGSTTTTTQPAPFFSDRRLKTDIKRIGKTDDGLPIYSYKYKGDNQTQLGLMADEVEKKHPEAVGKTLGYKTVDYEKATKAEGGSVYGANIASNPYGGTSYVPEAYLKVGDLMRAEGNVEKPTSAFDEMNSLVGFGKQMMSLGDTFGQVKGWFSDPEQKAVGGTVGEAPYLNSQPEIPKPDSYVSDTLEKQDQDNESRKSLMEAKPAPPPQSGASAVGSAAGGIGSLLSGIAGIFALSDRRAKHDIKRIGEADNGTPIYSFKYKGSDETHIGFMADEVEDRHPKAVHTGQDGLKRVDLGQADKFSRGGYADGGETPVVVPDPNAGAVYTPLLEAIKSEETPNLGSNVIYGGQTFDAYADHPRVRVPIKGGKDYSTAAGDYQMIEGTWDAARDALNLDSFSPNNQKEAAIWTATNDYKRRTGNDLGSDIRAGNYADVRDGLKGTWAGLKNLGDEDFAKFFAPKSEDTASIDVLGRSHGGRAGYLDGGEIERIVEKDPNATVYGTVVEKPVTLGTFKETPRRYTPPGFKISDMDGETLVKSPKVLPLETRTLGDTPKVAVADTSGEKPLVSVDRGRKPISSLMSAIASTESPGYNVIYGGQKFDDFSDHPRVYVPITSGPNRGRKSSAAGKYQFIGSTWDEAKEALGLKDFSPASQDKAAEWLARRDYKRNTGRDLDEDLAAGKISDIRRGLSSTWEGLQKIRDDDFAGRVNRGVKEAVTDVADGVKTLGSDVYKGAKTLGEDVVSGAKTLGRETGDVIGNTTSGIKGMLDKATSNQDILLSVLSGLGTMASSPSRYLGSAILQGIGGGANTYASLRSQTPDIAAKNIENVKNLTNAWQQYVYLNPDHKDMTLPEFAQKFGYEKYLPENKPVDINPNSDSKIKLKGDDIRDEPRSYSSEEIKTATVNGVPAFNDPGYLTAWIAANKGKAEFVPALAREVQAAEEQLARIQSTGTTYGPDGKPEIAPGVAEAQSDISKAATNRETRAEFVKALPARAKAADEADTNLLHMEKAFQGFTSGAMTDQLGGLAAVFRKLDPNDVSGVASTLAAAGNDPAKIQEAKKLASRYLADQMKGVPEGAPKAMMEWAETITPGTEMQPEAVRAIIVMAKADVMREKAMLKAYNDAGQPDDVVKFQTDFINANPREKFMEIAEKNTPQLGLAEDVAPPTQAEIDAMTLEERKAILGQ